MTFGLALGCTAKETVVEATDFKFDGTCVNCHAGLNAGHVHANYKLRCVDCHGGNDQVATPDDVLKNKSTEIGKGGFRDPALLKMAHVIPDKANARYFYANGVDEDGDGTCFKDPSITCTQDSQCGAGDKCRLVDEPINFVLTGGVPTSVTDTGEVFEPGLHGNGPGEFMDAELNRDLNYTRFMNPGDLRVATISCGGGSRGAFDGGGNGSCHQQTIDIVRRSIMVGQSAVTNGAYYGNESWRQEFIDKRGDTEDPRFGGMSYNLDYDGSADGTNKGADSCIKPPADPKNPRSQPTYDVKCLEDRAVSEDPILGADPGGLDGVFSGNNSVATVNGVAGAKPFQIAQGKIDSIAPPGTTLEQIGAGDTRLPWGGNSNKADAHEQLQPLGDDSVIPPGALGGLEGPRGIPDPVDNILRTFRAYYPMNYPASTNNFNFTFGTSILPEIKRFRTATPYGRGHSSGCAGCHAPYNYEGNRSPQKIRNEDPQDTNGNGKLDDEELFTLVEDPTTKHREFDPANDQGPVNGAERLIGRPVNAAEVLASGGVAKGAVDLDGDGTKDGEQERTYSDNHIVTTKIDTDTCGLCHGFVTRINYAYQGMAEEEQRDALARRKEIDFETPGGTQVRILDSWVREDFDADGNGVLDAIPTIVTPAGVAVVNAARERDAKLAKDGFLPGFGGCVPAVFTEDCNNNGELDTSLTLNKLDIDGNVVASVTINEDANGNNKLDLIDRLPREKAIDGRQVRYVYGGRNGSTRQMDVHFQVGMHCIDCHFLQDVHGDGNVYSTNWDAIEIECEDCHGAANKTNFITSGPNGGNDLRKAKNEDLEPFFEERNGNVIQRSRVTRGLSWIVPQTKDINASNSYAREAHLPQHVGEPGEGSKFAGEQGQSEMTEAKVECASCHNGWITNCLGCHVEINIGDKQRNFLEKDGTISKSAGENEIWVRNKHNPGHINFQLLGLLRAPLVLNSGGKSEGGRLSTVRSSMQALVSVSDVNGDQIRDNLTFTTFQALDANSGRTNVATSGVAMNQTMAHTVRPKEARGCETCHALVDTQGRITNEHLIAQTYGLGTGSLAYAGDWLYAAGLNGLELYEYKQERELANNLNGAAQQIRFPGMIVNDTLPTAAKVEPTDLVGVQADDVLLIRNFNATPAMPGGTQPPTLTDLAVLGTTNGAAGRIFAIEVGGRGHPNAAVASPANVANPNRVSVYNTTTPVLSLAHIGSDVSDPFVYGAIGAGGIVAVRILNIPDGRGAVNCAVANGNQCKEVKLGNLDSATEVVLAGDIAYVGTQQGRLHMFDLSDPANPVEIGAPVTITNTKINDMAVNGMILYIATNSGLTAAQIDEPDEPIPPFGVNAFVFAGPATALGVAVSEGHAYVANGANGVHEIDMRLPAAPVDLGTIGLTNGTEGVGNFTDVIVSLMQGQKWVMALRDTGDVLGIKLDTRLGRQERCYPDPGTADCLLELEMNDPTRSGRDPSFNPVTGLFDNPAVDPSAKTTLVLANAAGIIANGRRLARPVFWEAIGTLTGRRYRDSYMPGAGVMSLQVMQKMYDIQVCVRDGGASTNPNGLDETGYLIDNDCVSFDDSTGALKAKARHRASCKPGVLGDHMHKMMCEPRRERRRVRTATPPVNHQPSPIPPKTAEIVGLAPTKQ
ncbi:MAG: hypothetical protein ABI867_03550 [Kofleriaceae bacterium]